MLFLDLEIYVPAAERAGGHASMVADPTREAHTFLGGCFVSKRFSEPVPDAPAFQHLWIWDFDSEKDLLAAIVDLFELEWQKQFAETTWILGKPATDLVVCGTGIAKFDMPALFYRAQALGVGSPSAMYELFLKARSIDLAHTASFLFPEEPVLYPKTAREMGGRLKIGPKKGSSTKVWDMYDKGDYGRIANRTQGSPHCTEHLPGIAVADTATANSGAAPGLIVGPRPRVALVSFRRRNEAAKTFCPSRVLRRIKCVLCCPD